MKRWVIAQALLSTTLRLRPIIPGVCSIPLLERRSFPHYYDRVCGFSDRIDRGGGRPTSQSFTTTVPFISCMLGWSKYNCITTTTRTFVTLRGGISSSNSSSDGHGSDPLHPKLEQEYTVLSHPAPGSPFHYAFPVHDLDLTKEFYGNILGCIEGRSSSKWQDYSLHGHQIVAHWVGHDYRCQDYYNPVDGDEVPVPHTGLALTVDQFHELAERLREAGVQFIIEPHLRFKGMPGEQYTMFFKDPSGNNLEFKAMTNPQNLFAKYNVNDN